MCGELGRNAETVGLLYSKFPGGRGENWKVARVVVQINWVDKLEAKLQTRRWTNRKWGRLGGVAPDVGLEGSLDGCVRI